MLDKKTINMLELINKGFSEIAYFGKRFYPICKYFEKKYSYDQDEIDFLEISPDQLKEFLEVVKKKELLEKKNLKIRKKPLVKMMIMNLSNFVYNIA